MTNETKQTIKSETRFNLSQIISFVIAALVIVWLYGCESKVPSLVQPERTVTRAGLQAELNNFLALAEIRFARLDKKDELRNIVIQQALIIAEAGTINPLGLITTALSIFGTGALIDNVRMRKERKRVGKEKPNGGSD